ncbi:MAG: hypothetical protein IKQ99_02775 [Alphaproteobacteria bacterium]|nr:hypothetical protein [Alphaproteobacteria bacterium]
MTKKDAQKLNERLTDGAREGVTMTVLTDAVLGLLPGANLVKIMKSAGKGAVQGAIMSLDEDENSNDAATDIPEKIGENLVSEMFLKGAKTHKR